MQDQEVEKEIERWKQDKERGALINFNNETKNN